MDTYAERLTASMAAIGVSVSALANHLGISYQAVKKAVEGKTAAFSAENNFSAAELLGVDAKWLATGQGSMSAGGGPVAAGPQPIELENNPDYPAVRRVSVKAQAGITGYAVESCEELDPIVFRASWYKAKGYRPERLMALKVAGHSMEPSLHEGDLILVNTESATPKDGVPFLVVYEGEVVVKRLVRDAGAWWLASDHPDQRRYARKLCDDQTQIIGEVVYKQSERV